MPYLVIGSILIFNIMIFKFLPHYLSFNLATFKFQPHDFQNLPHYLSFNLVTFKFQPRDFQVSTSRLSSFNLATFKFETEEIDLSQTYTPTQIQTTHKHTHTLKNSFSITHNTTQTVRKLKTIQLPKYTHTQY